VNHNKTTQESQFLCSVSFCEQFGEPANLVPIIAAFFL
jgi:hypothetical protein